MKVLRNAGVKLKLRKCEFFVERIKHAVNIVRPGTIETDQATINALRKVGYHVTQTQLRSIFGFCNVHRRFVSHHAKLAHLLNQLLKKGQPLQLDELSDAHKNTFHDVKDCFGLILPTIRFVGGGLFGASTLRLEVVSSICDEYYVEFLIEREFLI